MYILSLNIDTLLKDQCYSMSWTKSESKMRTMTTKSSRMVLPEEDSNKAVLPKTLIGGKDIFSVCQTYPYLTTNLVVLISWIRVWLDSSGGQVIDRLFWPLMITTLHWEVVRFLLTIAMGFSITPNGLIEVRAVDTVGIETHAFVRRQSFDVMLHSRRRRREFHVGVPSPLLERPRFWGVVGDEDDETGSQGACHWIRVH